MVFIIPTDFFGRRVNSNCKIPRNDNRNHEWPSLSCALREKQHVGEPPTGDRGSISERVMPSNRFPSDTAGDTNDNWPTGNYQCQGKRIWEVSRRTVVSSLDGYNCIPPVIGWHSFLIARRNSGQV